MKKYIFPILIALSALSLAGAAAFFSVTGLSKLFGGAEVEVIIMASALEFAKLVTASFLHRYWKVLKWQMKTYLTIGVVTVMLITSAGIYGFLSNAYSATSGKLQNMDTQIQMIEQKKNILNSEIARLQENKTLKSDRVKSLTSLRSNQETRLDSLYNRRQTSSAKRVEQQIEQASKDIVSINIEIDTLNNQINRKSSETTSLDLEVLNLKNSDVNGEVGPLKYIAKLTGKDMDSVVNFFILLLIFVFDPLAVSLVIATNIAIEKEIGKKEDSKKSVEEPAIEEPVIEEPVIEEPVVEEPVVEEPVVEEPVIEEPVVEEPVVEEPVVEEPVIEEPVIESDSKKKTDEVIRYVADNNGEFKPAESIVSDENKEKIKKTIMAQIKAEGIEHNASYLSFLDVLFKQGKAQIGDALPTYNTFLEEIKASGFKCTEKEVKDFITICNLFAITDMSGPSKKIAKDYPIAKEIISLLSK